METDSAASPALAELTRRMARGEDAAWQQFHREHGPRLFRSLLAAAHGDPHLAAEALQHAYLRIARHVRVCENEARWAGWLQVVARSALSDTRRRQFRFWQMLRRRAAEPADAPSDSADNLLLAALDASLAQLPPETRALLAAKYFSRESVQGIADRLGLSAKAVESRLTRARAELRERLNLALQQTPHD
jgi:RNA polymerase sigma factor (sigma-70 family)